ncbi:hypothetical protein Pan97_12610 [Bremerella volcania]|uniref:Uncharacterized protein n=1 Tax=Bremerella volcania TaxID=2527984 RepID=A0A518C4Z0_9BACT|nr:AAA family ATPase [Bremerella volcania]QDU74254.1 hypothetical protein Pan97_12610 [Bremerella volcania]
MRCGLTREVVVETLIELILDNKIGVIFGADDNPHIQRLGFGKPEDQSARISAEFQEACAYPRPPLLEPAVDESKYINEPYKHALALGEPQLAFRVFDLSVLEFYRNDPRYLYYANDMSGRICISDDHFQKGTIAESDEILLKTFGFAYDSEMNRGVAVFLRYLRDLSSEHQQIWKAKQLHGNYTLHPEYFNSSLGGIFPSHISIHDAFLAELYVVNCMAKAMGRKPLFRQDFGPNLEGKPPKFSFLIRPTASEFYSYILLLDQLLSENINVHFFGEDIEREEDVERQDGKVEVQRKGTIRILDEWTRKFFTFSDLEQWNACIAAMKRVRKLRQKPAHAVNEDHFNQQYFKEQREVILEAYRSIRTIRLLFARHPKVIEALVDVPNVLLESKVLPY